MATPTAHPRGMSADNSKKRGVQWRWVAGRPWDRAASGPSPAALAPLCQMRPLGPERCVPSVPGVDPGLVGQPVEDLFHQSGVQRVEPCLVLVRVPDAAGEQAMTGRLLAVDWRAVASPPSVASSLTSANGPGSTQETVLPGNWG